RQVRPFLPAVKLSAGFVADLVLRSFVHGLTSRDLEFIQSNITGTSAGSSRIESAYQLAASKQVGGGFMALATNKGIIDNQSSHSVDETVDRLKNMLQAKGVTLFALVDHSGEAEKVGMKMLQTKLLIFGSPKAGTPLMLAAPSSAIDLPLKLLVWQDSQDKVWITYNSPDYLRDRHNLPQELLANIAVVEALATNAGQ